MTRQARDRLDYAGRAYAIVHGAHDLFDPKRHGMPPVRGGLSTGNSRGLVCAYRVREDGSLVLDRCNIDLLDVRSAVPLFGVEPSFPDGPPEENVSGTVRYDFSPDGVVFAEKPVTLIVGEDLDGQLELVHPMHSWSWVTHRAASVYPYRTLRELRFERASAQKVGIRLSTTIDHSAALEEIRETVGPRGGEQWWKRLALEASSKLGPFFLVNPGDFERDVFEEFERLTAKIDALERDDASGDD